MNQISTFFEYIACLFGFLASGILVFVNKEPSHSKNVLAITLFFLSTTGLVGVFFLDGIFLKYPYLFRVNQPFTLLVLPGAYIYIRSVLRSETQFFKHDWLLLIPAILTAINLMPFYLLSVNGKREIIQNQLNNVSLQTKFNEGFLPPYVFSFFRIGWSAFFVIINFRMLGAFKKTMTGNELKNNAALMKWLTTFNSLFAILVFSIFVAAIFAPIIKIGISLVDFTVGSVLLVICVQLFARPKLLYGIFMPIHDQYSADQSKEFAKEPNALDRDMEQVAEKEDLEAGEPNEEIFHLNLVVDETERFRYKQKIENFFKERTPYLQTDYSLEQLVTDTNIPRYILSSFINREYGMGFREYLNRHRIEYFIEYYNKPDWKNLTLEAISVQCGFSSRSTFISNFKQITGQKPSEFIREHFGQDLEKIA